MKLDIKSMILEEGILDGFKSNTGLAVTGLAGAAAGAAIHNNFKNSGNSSFGNYLGQKFDNAVGSTKQFGKDFFGSNSTGTKDSSAGIGHGAEATLI